LLKAKQPQRVAAPLQMERGIPVTVQSVLAAEVQNRKKAHHRRQHERTVLLIKQGFWTHYVPVLVGWLKLVNLCSSVAGAYHLWS